jgi:hypothetical protein
MIAIETKYLAPTNSRGSRIKAFTCNGHSFSIPYPYELSNEKAHFAAVKAMVAAKGLDWYLGNMRFGGTKNGYVFCFDISKVEA